MPAPQPQVWWRPVVRLHFWMQKRMQILVGGAITILEKTWTMMDFVNGFRMTSHINEMEHKSHVPKHQRSLMLWCWKEVHVFHGFFFWYFLTNPPHLMGSIPTPSVFFSTRPHLGLRYQIRTACAHHHHLEFRVLRVGRCWRSRKAAGGMENPYNVGPPSDVNWFIKPSNYSYKYHKP